MTRSLFALLGVTLWIVFASSPVRAQQVDPALAKHFRAVYAKWRTSMIKKDLASWKSVTATHRQTEIRNRIYSEKRPFAQTLFGIPVAPPDVKNLKLLTIKVKGPTANAIFFGGVDFGVGGKLPNNLFVVGFTQEGRGWKYDKADFVNLGVLPDVRKDLEAGKLAHLNKPEFDPPGRVVPPRVALRGPVAIIAKTYVFCPGREVQVQVNKISRHTFQNTKAAEVVIGGAKVGVNEVQYTAKGLPGGEGIEPLTIRVYLFSQVQGVKPIKIFQYQVEEKGKVNPVNTLRFHVTKAHVQKLLGK